MLIALGTEAAMTGHRVRYTLATKLVNELVEAADEKQLNKTIAARDASISSVSTNLDTWNSTGTAPNSSSRS